MSKKTIIHVIDNLGRGGAETMLYSLLQEHVNDYNIILITLDERNDFPELPCEHYCLHYKGLKNLLPVILRFKKIIKKHKPVLIRSQLLMSTIITRLALKGNPGIKHVFSIHNMLSEDAFKVNRLSLMAEKITHNKSQVIIGVSQEVLRDYDEYVGIKGKSYKLYNFVGDIFFEQNYMPRQDVRAGMKLVAVGNLRRQKNYFTLLKAFQKLKEYPIHLDIYGAGDLENEFTKYINENGLNVSLRGRSSEISSVLKEYDAYIMSSLFEGFGIAPMEAMAIGLPVLLSDIPVLKEVAEDKPFYFDPKNENEIAEVILYAYNNWSEVLQRSSQNSTFVMEKASRKSYSKLLVDIYEEVLNA